MAQVIYTAAAPAAIGPYSQAVKANGMLFTSGQIGIVPATGKMAEGLAAQVEQVMQNLDDTVTGLSCWVAELEDLQEKQEADSPQHGEQDSMSLSM